MADLSLAPLPLSAASGLSAAPASAVDPYGAMHEAVAASAAAQRGFSAVRVAAPPPGVAAFGAAVPQAAQLMTQSVAPPIYTQYP